MKKILILPLLFLAIFAGANAQQDSLYIFRENTIVWKEAIERVDSITFQRNNAVAEPTFISFSFLKVNNEFLPQDIHCDVSKQTIRPDVPLSNKKMIANFVTSPGNTVKVKNKLQTSGVTITDFTSSVVYVVTTPTGESEQYVVNINWLTGIPEIRISTVDAEPVVEKKKEVRCYVQIDGKGLFENFADSAVIRGRGNSTWGMPKKPYRFDLDKASELLGIATGRKWILLAEYLDPTLLMNSMAMKAGRLLELPFTNHTVAVALTLNGEFQGVYTFTEHKEVEKNRIDISKSDGILLEFDTYFDEEYKFYSPGYNLPVMIQNPGLDKLNEEERNFKFNLCRNYFVDLENALLDPTFPNNSYKQLIDIESVAKYLFVYDLTHNMELNHPKSTYIHKDKDQKFVMGIIWDFDWAFSYEGTGRHFSNYERPLLQKLSSSSTGTAFFSRFFDDPAFKKLYREIVIEFKYQHLDTVLKHIENNATNITPSQILDYNKWGGARDYDAKINEMKTWIVNRMAFIDSYTETW